jgi:hypothetical protein
LLLLCGGSLIAQDTVFSGPQVGEKLRGFKAIQLVGEQKGETFDLMAEAGGKPVLIIFFHKLTRPAFGLTRLLLSYAEGKTDELVPSVIMLSDDPKATMELRALAYFPTNLPIGVSPDGLEGPGAYGLNRNVELTVLVGKDSQVTANFAIVQPSLPSDGPKILAAIASAIGEDPPSLEELQEKMQASNPRMRAQRMQRRERNDKTQEDNQ